MESSLAWFRVGIGSVRIIEDRCIRCRMTAILEVLRRYFVGMLRLPCVRRLAAEKHDEPTRERKTDSPSIAGASRGRRDNRLIAAQGTQ